VSSLGQCLWALRPHRGLAVLAVVVCSLATVPTLAAPLLVGRAVDAMRAGDRGQLEMTVALLAATALATAVLWTVRVILVSRMSGLVERDVRGGYFAKLTALELSEFSELGVGQAIARGTTDLRAVRSFLNSGLPLGAQSATTFVLTALAMLWIEPLLFLASLVPVSLIALTAATRSRGGAALAEASRRALSAVTEELEESLAGIAVVRAFGQEQVRETRFARAVDAAVEAALVLSRKNAAYSAILSAAPILGLVLVLGVGGTLAIGDHGLSDGEFVSYYLYFLLLVSPASSLSTVVTLTQGAASSIRRVREVLDTGRSPGAPAPGAVSERPTGAVVLGEVTAGYRADRPVLSGADLQVQPGEVVALTGASGSGKSLVLALVKRLYYPVSGSVTLGGVDVGSSDAGFMQSHVALVGDDEFLFAGSVRDNIAYGRPDATPEAVTRAATAPQASGFIAELPLGYDTQVGERSSRLSGGQRQRVALARALLMESPVVLLDNATGGLDGATERQVIQAVTDGADAVVFSGDNPAVLDAADRVVVMDGGRVTEAEPVPNPYPSQRRVAPPPAPAATGLTSPKVRLEPPRSSAGPPAAGLNDDGKTRKARRRREIVTLLAGDRRALALSALAIALATGAGLLPAYIAGRAVDDVLGPASDDVLWELCGLLLVVAGLSGVAVYFRTVLVARVGQGALGRLRIRLFSHLDRVSLSFFDRNDSATVISRLTNDVEVLNVMVQNGLSVLISSVLTFVGTAGVLLVLDPGLAFIAYLTAPLIFALSLVLRRARDRANRKATGGVVALTRELMNTVHGARAMKCFGQEGRHRARFAQLNEQQRVMLHRSNVLQGAFTLWVELVTGGAIAALVLIGGLQALDGAVAVGTVVAFTMYLRTAMTPIGSLVNLQGLYGQSGVSFDRLLDLLHEPVPVPGPGTADETDGASGVSLERVWFAHPGRDWTLRDINIDVPRSETLALVGASGAGKSTIVRLVAGFLAPQDGRVRLGGRDVRGLSRDAITRTLAVVPQEPFLFSGTVGDNVGFAAPHATREEMERVLEELGIGELLHVDQEVGRRGASLSSSQRQLVSLARALIIDPTVLLLDEATSTVDRATEEVVQRATAHLRSGRTTIVVAHRLATIASADRIAVLDGGVIVELGTHEGLLARAGLYSRMWAAASREQGTP
jgi:ATP-binding cassette, subfamily B, bacterial